MTGGCAPYVPSTKTTSATGFYGDTLELDGMIDPKMPNALKNKQDVMVPGKPPLTFTVTLDLTHN